MKHLKESILSDDIENTAKKRYKFSVGNGKKIGSNEYSILWLAYQQVQIPYFL